MSPCHKIAHLRSTESSQQDEFVTHLIHFLYQNLRQFRQVSICSICSHYTTLKWHSQFIQINLKCHFWMRVSYSRMTQPHSVWVWNLIHKSFCDTRLQVAGTHLSASVTLHLTWHPKMFHFRMSHVGTFLSISCKEGCTKHSFHTTYDALVQWLHVTGGVRLQAKRHTSPGNTRVIMKCTLLHQQKHILVLASHFALERDQELSKQSSSHVCFGDYF
jgi:hypothetical protein